MVSLGKDYLIRFSCISVIMTENEIRLYFKLKNGEHHKFLKLVQKMKEDDKSIYIFPTLEQPKIKKLGVLNKKEKKLKYKSVEEEYNYPKISIHYHGQVHVKSQNSDKKFIKFNIGPLPELNHPRKICTIFPTNPSSYPLKSKKGKVDMNIDLKFIKKGIFACELYVISPLEIDRVVKNILFPINSGLSSGTEGRLIYKEFRGFGFFIFIYQEPVFKQANFDKLEHWFFNKKPLSKITPIELDGRRFQKNGITINISKPKIEVKKVT